MGFCTELFLVTSGPASAERAIAPVISRSGLISSGGSLLVPPKPTQPANWIRNVKPTVFRSSRKGLGLISSNLEAVS
jgi:hypothetical protein